jgi:hypothetical protein
LLGSDVEPGRHLKKEFKLSALKLWWMASANVESDRCRFVQIDRLSGHLCLFPGDVAAVMSVRITSILAKRAGRFKRFLRKLTAYL